MQQAGAYAQAAGAYAGSARYAIEAGKANARETIRAAAQIQAKEDFALAKVNKERRLKVAQGRGAFAANGWIVDSGAAALWEQDEAADAVIEKIQIMQSAENENYNAHVQAKQLLAQGYQTAGGMYGQAASMAMQGYSAALGAQGALQQAAGTQGPSGLALALNVIGAAANVAGNIEWGGKTNETIKTASGGGGFNGDNRRVGTTKQMTLTI